MPVWGTAEARAKVDVRFAGQHKSTTADQNGRWKLTLDPMKASAVGREMIIRSGDTVAAFKDVLVGEVWFAGGQSNMGYTCGSMAKHLPEGKTLVATASFPSLRFCRVSEQDAPQPLDGLQRRAKWDVCSPENVVRHSAVAFVFARRLHLELNAVPVGVIDCSWGGKPIEPFIPLEAFHGHPTLEKLARLAEAGDEEGIRAMAGGTWVRSSSWLPGTIYNSRISPVRPYAIRGAIWYQAESNCGQGEDPRDYAHKMRALIRGWRSAWNRDELPIYYVQLPQWRSYAWTWAREEQRKALDVANTGMVVTIDLDNGGDIHPPNKIDVGERLALWPLARDYGRDVTAKGPMFREAKIAGNEVTVVFDAAESGLMIGRAKGVLQVETDAAGTLNGFELCTESGRWFAAEARIREQRLIVTSDRVPEPVAVRYACHPEAPADAPWNLYSRAGLPASPFCSHWRRMPYDPASNKQK